MLRMMSSDANTAAANAELFRNERPPEEKNSTSFEKVRLPPRRNSIGNLTDEQKKPTLYEVTELAEKNTRIATGRDEARVLAEIVDEQETTIASLKASLLTASAEVMMWRDKAEEMQALLLIGTDVIVKMEAKLGRIENEVRNNAASCAEKVGDLEAENHRMRMQLSYSDVQGNDAKARLSSGIADFGRLPRCVLQSPREGEADFRSVASKGTAEQETIDLEDAPYIQSLLSTSPGHVDGESAKARGPSCTPPPDRAGLPRRVTPQSGASETDALSVESDMSADQEPEDLSPDASPSFRSLLSRFPGPYQHATI